MALKMDNILALLTAFGVGSIVSAVIQFFLSNRAAEKKHIYNERKEAYIGLLESWQMQEMKGFSDDTKLEVGHWFLRCRLVASKNLDKRLQDWMHTEGTEARPKATDALKEAMRLDLSRL